MASLARLAVRPPMVPAVKGVRAYAIKPSCLALSQAAPAQPKPAAAAPPPPAPPAGPPMVDLTVDGKPVRVPAGTPIIIAAEQLGISIPRFCYHERLAIAGNCRMCLVELERNPKPAASCAMPVAPGMKVLTDTPLVRKAREGVMEFLLANHPLDCPVCDQGGECDLQDQSVRFGSDRGRFNEPVGKRAVEDKNIGPLVKTVMTRCIQCTRCVRFANEIAGAPELGTSGRGNEMQIGTYVEKVLDSELSGNLVDLCPVGALTSKPYSFNARPWELRHTESIDVLDAVGSNIRIDTRGVEVMRILPRLNEDVNEEWIADKTRFAYDALKRQRLTTPLIREDGKFVAVGWEAALSRIAEQLVTVKGSEMLGLVGPLVEAESVYSLQQLFRAFNSADRVFSDGAPIQQSVASSVFRSAARPAYLYNTSIVGTERADAILLIGTNPRHEAPLINARIRKNYIANDVHIGLIGKKSNLTYEYDHLGETVAALKAVVEGRGSFAANLAKAKRPMIIVGSGVVEHPDGAAILGLVGKLLEKHQSSFFQKDWNGYNFLQRHAGRVGALDLGVTPRTNKTGSTKPKFIYLLGADEIQPSDIPENAFVVYQGHHGDIGANFADVILPGSAYTEKSGTFANTEGRVQVSNAAVRAPGQGKEDWKVLRALSELLGSALPYDTLQDLRAHLAHEAPALGVRDVLVAPNPADAGKEIISALQAAGQGAGASDYPIENPIKDYYITDSISRNSQTMAKCSAAYTHKISMAQLEPSKYAELSV